MSTLVKQIPFDWKQKSILDGRGYHVDIGAFSTPIVGGGNGTAFDQDQPEGVISVPSGTTIIPIRIGVQCQVPLLAADANEVEILIAADIAAAHTANATTPPTSETALKLYVGHPKESLCTCYSASTANSTNPTLGLELAHKVITADKQNTPVTALWGDLELLYEPEVGNLLVGPCALYVYWGGTVATSGFAQIEWLEFLTSDL
jgi:hypothetical protein